MKTLISSHVQGTLKGVRVPRVGKIIRATLTPFLRNLTKIPR